MSTIHITIGTSQNGKACGTGDYEVGSQATIVATPDSGYVFVTWDDGVTLNPRTVNATANATYKAEFDGVTPPPTPTPSGVIRYNAPTAVLGSWVATCTDTTRNTYDTNTGNGVLYLNSGVTTIGGGRSTEYSPFCNKTDLVSVELGSQITTIDNSAFYLSGLSSITIPNSVTTIVGYAFGYCTGLTSITIPNGVTTIGYDAFTGSGLTSVTIPSSVTSIDRTAFDSCNALTSIIVDSSNTTYNDGNGSNCIIETSTSTLIIGFNSSVIPNGVTTIGYAAFSSRSGLTSITIPNSVTTISDFAFNYCTGLASITIPNSVTTIGNNAFGNCTGLTSISIGSGVTSIGDSTFRWCSSLTTVTCYATTPPTLGSNNFGTSSDTLKVPSGSVSAYQSNSSWSSAFTTITSI